MRVSTAGKTGIPTTLGLLEKGFRVRAFVRRQDARSQRLEEAGAELFVGDHPLITDGAYAASAEDWVRLHLPRAGFIDPPAGLG